MRKLTFSVETKCEKPTAEAKKYASSLEKNRCTGVKDWQQTYFRLYNI